MSAPLDASSLWLLGSGGRPEFGSTPDEQPGLGSCDALVHQDLHLNATILGPSRSALVGRSRLEFAHCARCHDAPHRYVALPHQVANHCFGAIFAQSIIHGRPSGRIGKALHLDDVSVQAEGCFRELFQLLLIFFRDGGTGRIECDGCFALYTVVVQPVEAICILLDVFNVLFNVLSMGSNRLLVGRDVLLIPPGSSRMLPSHRRPR